MLEAASGLFGSSGYDAVQMDDVARAAGVGKPTLYRYFGSKEELFLEVLGEVLQRLQLGLEEVAARPLPPTASLALMMRTLVDTLARHTEPLRLIAGDDPGLAHRLRAAFRNRRRPILDALRRVLERGVASGDFRPLDLEVTPALLLGMIRGGLINAPGVARERLAETAIDLVLHGGLAAPSSAADAAPSTPGVPFGGP
jgi:AcrR family transcriptional regulator